MKWFGVIFVLFCVVMGCLWGLSKYSLSNIILPKSAQHNTIGELPFVEAMDDGDFYEVDGDEDLTAYNCNRIMSERCDKECSAWWKKGDKMCNARCYLGSVGRCDLLHKKQQNALLAAGSYTARWMNFMEQKCGSWACGSLEEMEKYGKEWDEKMKKEWKESDTKDQYIWGNEGNFK